MRRFLHGLAIIVAFAPLLLSLFGLHEFVTERRSTTGMYLPVSIALLVLLMDVVDKGEATTVSVLLMCLATLLILAGWILRLAPVPVVITAWAVSLVGYLLRTKTNKRSAADAR